MVRKHDNRFIDWVCRKAGLSLQQRDLLHEDISREGLTKKEILERAKEIKELYPRK
jgi:hypothetical protein